MLNPSIYFSLSGIELVTTKAMKKNLYIRGLCLSILVGFHSDTKQKHLTRVGFSHCLFSLAIIRVWRSLMMVQHCSSPWQSICPQHCTKLIRLALHQMYNALLICWLHPGLPYQTIKARLPPWRQILASWWRSMCWRSRNQTGLHLEKSGLHSIYAIVYFTFYFVCMNRKKGDIVYTLDKKMACVTDDVKLYVVHHKGSVKVCQHFITSAMYSHLKIL